MSICNGVDGNRGRNPIGIFIHNDAGSQNANAAFYRNWLQTHRLENGFAHYYVAQDGVLEAEDDSKCAWHCGNLDGNLNLFKHRSMSEHGQFEYFAAERREGNAVSGAKVQGIWYCSEHRYD